MCKGKLGNRQTHRHDLSTFSDDPARWTDIHGGAVHAAAGFFYAPDDEKHAGLPGDAFEFLSGTVPAFWSRLFSLDSALTTLAHHHNSSSSVLRKFPPHPSLSPAGTAFSHNITQINGILEVRQVFVATFLGASPDGAAEVGSPRITTYVGFRKEEDVDLLGGCLLGDSVQGGEGFGRGWLCGGGCRS